MNKKVFSLSGFWRLWRYLFGKERRDNMSSDKIPLIFDGIRKDNKSLLAIAVAEIAEEVAKKIKSNYPNLFLERFEKKEWQPFWKPNGDGCLLEELAQNLFKHDFRCSYDNVDESCLPLTIEKTIINIDLFDSIEEAVAERILHTIRCLVSDSLAGTAPKIMKNEPKMIAMDFFCPLNKESYKKSLVLAKELLDKRPAEESDIDNQLEKFKYAVIASFNQKRQNSSPKGVNSAFWFFVNGRALIKINDSFILPKIVAKIFSE